MTRKLVTPSTITKAKQNLFTHRQPGLLMSSLRLPGFDQHYDLKATSMRDLMEQKEFYGEWPDRGLESPMQ